VSFISSSFFSRAIDFRIVVKLVSVLRLLLGADEEHRAAARGEVAHEAVRLAELLERLLQVDDVDAVALPEDVLLHLRVPALGLMAEMHSGLEQLLHGQRSHRSSFG
jgi:hypothetical protein